MTCATVPLTHIPVTYHHDVEEEGKAHFVSSASLMTKLNIMLKINPNVTNEKSSWRVCAPILPAFRTVIKTEDMKQHPNIAVK
mmetsp:Transcript_30794/g.45936  ORF Transcript_30794/g.45936 Transcript_30794/m.45936 type:complete len:83 (-) Transcript_30794:840-1088(-)